MRYFFVCCCLEDLLELLLVYENCSNSKGTFLLKLLSNDSLDGDDDGCGGGR